MTRSSAIFTAVVPAVALLIGFGCNRNEPATPAIAGAPAGAAPYNGAPYSADNVPVADVPSYANAQCVRTISTQPAEPPAPRYADQPPYSSQQYNGQYTSAYTTGQNGAYGPRYYAAPNPAPEYVYQPAPRTRVIVKRRPLRRSLAIVGGSAGVGAAIGAIAGGGPGAGIGALAGGSAGFIYDRLTHKKRVVVRE